MDFSPQATLSMGIFRQEHWSGLPFPTPGDLPTNPWMEPASPATPALADRFFATEPPGKSCIRFTKMVHLKN